MGPNQIAYMKCIKFIYHVVLSSQDLPQDFSDDLRLQALTCVCFQSVICKLYFKEQKAIEIYYSPALLFYKTSHIIDNKIYLQAPIAYPASFPL